MSSTRAMKYTSIVHEHSVGYHNHVWCPMSRKTSVDVPSCFPFFKIIITLTICSDYEQITLREMAKHLRSARGTLVEEAKGRRVSVVNFVSKGLSMLVIVDVLWQQSAAINALQPSLQRLITVIWAFTYDVIHCSWQPSFAGQNFSFSSKPQSSLS